MTQFATALDIWSRDFILFTKDVISVLAGNKLYCWTYLDRYRTTCLFWRIFNVTQTVVALTNNISVLPMTKIRTSFIVGMRQGNDIAVGLVALIERKEN